MKFLKTLILSILFFCIHHFHSQNNLRIKKFPATTQTIQIDTLSIQPGSLQIFCSEQLISENDFDFDFASTELRLKNLACDTIVIKYRVFSILFSKPFQIRDESVLFNGNQNERDKFLISSSYSVDDVFGGKEIAKQGSISRGVSFGNNQDLGINSSLNLELSGQISPQLKILASISDANIPIQPDGTTNKLQEFDQLYIQIYNDQFKLIGGDFWLSKPEGYFLTYKKRAQGLTNSFSLQNKHGGKWKNQISGALSKGKFNRQIIQGIESNQGPYRLRGSDNEPFIIVLSGTERIYIDGKLLERGQELDYIIDYNNSEITFTSRNLITKDSRIVAEFQYSDQNYARSLFQNSLSYESKKMKFWLNIYSEQDAKNQSLQQKLDNQQKQYLSTIGDSILLARISSIDSVGYFPNQILYKLIDSLGYDSVLVFTTNPDLAKFNAVFLNVGANKGNYILEQQIALGKIYKWVEPINGIPQGNYNPSRLISTPKKKQFISTGIYFPIFKKSSFEVEMALSNNDQNTFSTIGNKDNKGYATIIKWKNRIDFKIDTLNPFYLENQFRAEYLNRSFSPIEQFRTVEFDRDWNIRGQNYFGNQTSIYCENRIKKAKNGSISLDLQYFAIGNDFNGKRIYSDGNWKQKGWNFNWDASYLNSNSILKNNFLRHRSNISKRIGNFQFGYQDDHEFNTFQNNISSLESKSYQFYDYQFYVTNADSLKNSFKITYRERVDWRPSNNNLTKAAKATTSAAELHIKSIKNNTIKFISGIRNLQILDSTIIQQQPESTLIGRVEYDGKYWKNALSISSFYEIGSGLEQKRDFIYLKVNDGQGVYTWVDYDGDGIEDLNEFEIAQFIDQASYIRIFIPSSDYIKTYTNELNGSVFFRPEKLVQKRKGIIQKLSLISNQTRVRVMKKIDALNYNELFNPFESEIRDSNLISMSSSIKNSLFFNRNSPIFGIEYNFQKVSSKTILASGFDSRYLGSNEISARWNITKTISIIGKFTNGNKISIIDYTINRNYEIHFQNFNSEIAYQPNTNLRIGLVGQYSSKINQEIFGGEFGKSIQFSINGKYNESKKGSFLLDYKTVSNSFNGNSNSAVGFEILEGLKPGINHIWTINYQRLLSKNLQFSIQYLGRKSEGNRIIHSGGMELRALF
jgi:hypothetical protein